ncbi:hypothetical protein KAU33_04520 [Candidatus Dependentiae bacterium]|nr:hypothetical protein [Candidatus Dependentiae bacterium]
MKLIDKYSLKGINSHLIWIYEGNGRTAGINRNNDVFGDKYCCFEDNGIGEGCETIWYPTLEAARKVVKKYLNGEISNIPVNKC